jgi:ribosomal protein S18 acetylase RimI-like enzyme
VFGSTKTRISIRPVKVDELDELAELYRELAGKRTDPGKMRENFEWMQSNPDYIVLGVKDAGGLIGSLMGIVCQDIVGECRPFMVIENVIVSRRYRRRGIGKGLMRKIEKIARERDCYYIMFVSKNQREEAHRFYESLGYGLDFVRGFKKYLAPPPSKSLQKLLKPIDT